MKFKFEEIYPNIFLYTFKSQYNLCMTFIRLSEFNESPYAKFFHKYFTLEEYMDWYVKNNSGNVFDYMNEWAGFNVQGTTFWKWYTVFMHNLRKKEAEAFIHILNLSEVKIKKSYFIGVSECEDKNDVIRHELAHALYFCNKEYKKEMNQYINAMPENERLLMNKRLKKQGYERTLYRNEMQAYLATSEPGIERISVSGITSIKRFKKLFEKYYSQMKLKY